MKQEISPKNHSNQLKSGTFSTYFKAFSAAFLLLITQTLFAQTGTWTALTNLAPHENMGVCLLLTDGTVICHDTNGPGNGTGWDRLTPDIHGSYINGTWSSIAPMTYDRLFFSSQV